VLRRLSMHLDPGLHGLTPGKIFSGPNTHREQWRYRDDLRIDRFEFRAKTRLQAIGRVFLCRFLSISLP